MDSLAPWTSKWRLRRLRSSAFCQTKPPAAPQHALLLQDLEEPGPGGRIGNSCPFRPFPVLEKEEFKEEDDKEEKEEEDDYKHEDEEVEEPLLFFRS